MANTPPKSFRITPETSAQIDALRKKWGASSRTEVLALAVKRLFDADIATKTIRKGARS